MGIRATAVSVVVAACLPLLGACATSGKFGGGESIGPPVAAAETTGTVASRPAPSSAGAPTGKSAASANDDLQLGRKYFRSNNFELAAQSFRAAAEKHAGDAASWIGLATAYDRLHRFDLADQAYEKAIAIAGPSAEILNDQGYSYMLRGDYKRAQKLLEEAEAKDPANPYVQDNMRVLAQHYFDAKSVQ